jgi:hypothetical protein
MANINIIGLAPLPGVTGSEWLPVVSGASGGNPGTTVRVQVSQLNFTGSNPGPQSANTLYAGPTSGGLAPPAFRALVLNDLPSGIYGTQTANLVWAGPSTGPSAAPTFRALVSADFPAPFNTVATTQTANTVFAGPTTGPAAAASFRAMVVADLPSTVYGTQTANQFYAGPTSAGPSPPAFRAMVVGDLPSSVYGTQSANQIYAGPTSGGALAPAFRALVVNDLPPGAVGQVLIGGASNSSFSSVVQLGASGTAGSITLGNNTSGLLTMQTVGGALGTVTLSIPAATDTLVARATSDTLSNKLFSDQVLCYGQNGIGYATGHGAGSTVSQSTNKTTAFTLNAISGQITLAAGSVGSLASAEATWDNSSIGAGDVICFSHVSGGTFGAYSFMALPTVGSAQFVVTNISGGSLNEQPVINFVVIKGTST